MGSFVDTRDFAEAFIGRLAREDFHATGSLISYLQLPEASRNGDEADVVDNRVTRVLCEALGYAGAEVTYNLGKDNLRPDFVTKIPDFPGYCFVIEDKATVERRLDTHFAQLAGYMAAFRCQRGLLVNGERILGYDHSGPISSATLQISLASAVRCWRGDDLLSAGQSGWDGLPQPEKDGLAVLARRYGRKAFEGISRLIDDLTLDRNGQPHALNGSTWQHGQTRISIVGADVAPDKLVEVVQQLIGELREDVAVQFAARKAEYESFREEIKRAPGSSAMADDLMAQHTDALLAVWPKGDDATVSDLRQRLYRAMRGDLPDSEIESVAAIVRSGISARISSNGDALSRRVADARAFAGRYSRHVLQARARHDSGVQAIESHDRWKAAVGTLLLTNVTAERALDEYFAQTAYLVVVRMLMVRVLEDKGLTPRVFTNGGAALWFRQVEPHYFSLARGRSAARFLEIAYENAQATYAHFFDDHRVFDWYIPDRITIIRVLHRLAGFDLSRMDRDIVGTIYGRFVTDRHKHEQGMYYTPPSVVGFILDRVGWQGRATAGGRLLDPACGSGAFLVEAARRAIKAHREQAKAEGHDEIPPDRVQTVLDSLRNGLVGFDLNPFACALAEINLLVQVLDLVAHAHQNGRQARIDRFRIYATDSLRLATAIRSVLERGLDQSEAEDLPEEEQAKAGLGLFADGFDVVVGNPPYVRADEGADGSIAYRRLIEGNPILKPLEVLKQKWDLFIPFVALGMKLMRRPDGRLGMIVSNAVENVLYADGLRKYITTASTLREVHFFERGVKLFTDAAVRNTIIILDSTEPNVQAETLREWHTSAPPSPSRRQKLNQSAYGVDIFRPTLPSIRANQNLTSHPLKHVCYTSVGMVLNADEKVAQGQFKLKDLLSDTRDAIHNKPYVGSEDLRLRNSAVENFPFAAMRVRYLEYNSQRVPSLIRRATFPELYDRDKLMVAKFGGAVHDDGTLSVSGYLTSNHTVFLSVPWRGLAGVRNRSLDEREKELGVRREELEQLSDLYLLPFLSGLFNSSPWAKIIEGRTTEAISGGTQPNDYADQLIPVPDPAIASAVGNLANDAKLEGIALAALLSSGWERNADGWLAPPNSIIGTQVVPLSVALTRWGLIIDRPDIKCSLCRREGDNLIVGQRVVAQFSPGTEPLAADFLLRVLKSQKAYTFRSLEMSNLPVPLRAEDAAKCERALRSAEADAHAREQRILSLRTEIDELVAPLFEPIVNPPIQFVD